MTVTNEWESVEGALLEHFASATLARTQTCCGPHFTEETEAGGGRMAGQGHTVVSSERGGVAASHPHACTPPDHPADPPPAVGGPES